MAVSELRAAWQRRLEATPSLEPHENDLERIQDDGWLQKFLDHNDGDQQLALQLLVDVVSWRKTFGANDIDETNINMDYIKEGLFYPRGKDIDGCTILIFKSKKHVKGQREFDQLMRCLVYWFERLDKIDHCDRISIFFDMADAGLSNMDMEFTKYIIGLFKSHYPDFLNYIIIYEMAWVLNAAFKIIKTLLPAKGVAKMKFITKSTVSQFVPLDQAQKSWGGEDDYTYAFVPANVSTNDVSSKKVTFADQGSPSQENNPGIENGPQSCSLMKLIPHDIITFKRENSEIIGSFTIMNTHEGSIAYKIKTTAPEKAKVSPNVGSLTPGKSESIKITLTLPGQNPSLSDMKIKFLVVCTLVNSDNLTIQELNDMWKNMSRLKIEQQRLYCSIPLCETMKKRSFDSSMPSSSSDKEITLLNESISSLKSSHDQLTMQLKSFKTLQLINVTLTALLTCLIAYLFRNIGHGSESCMEFYNGP